MAIFVGAVPTKMITMGPGRSFYRPFPRAQIFGSAMPRNGRSRLFWGLALRQILTLEMGITQPCILVGLGKSFGQHGPSVHKGFQDFLPHLQIYAFASLQLFL